MLADRSPVDYVMVSRVCRREAFSLKSKVDCDFLWPQVIVS